MGVGRRSRRRSMTTPLAPRRRVHTHTHCVRWRRFRRVARIIRLISRTSGLLISVCCRLDGADARRRSLPRSSTSSVRQRNVDRWPSFAAVYSREIIDDRHCVSSHDSTFSTATGSLRGPGRFPNKNKKKETKTTPKYTKCIRHERQVPSFSTVGNLQQIDSSSSSRRRFLVVVGVGGGWGGGQWETTRFLADQ